MISLKKSEFIPLCDQLAADNELLNQIIQTYGYPPFWSRPNTFETLVQIILEQQVSLASAKAAYGALMSRVSEITPETILAMSDDDFRASSFSRQKREYVRGVAGTIHSGGLSLSALEFMSDNEVRAVLKREKGIGDWTVDVYLIEVLHRPDVFPAGDIAARRALADVQGLQVVTPEEATAIAKAWQPYKTVATMLLWHHYLASRGRSDDMLAAT